MKEKKEILNEELFGIIFDYSKNNKKADKAFIDYVVQKLISYYCLSDYVKEFNIVPPKNNCNSIVCGFYDYQDKNGGIILQNIDYALKKIYSDYDLGEANDYFLFNSLVITYILHEFEHIIQNRDVHESEFKNILQRKNDELYLLFVSQIFAHRYIYNFIYEDEFCSKRRINRLYRKVYNFLPTERLADINSLSQIGDILSNNVIDLSNLSDIFLAEKYTALFGSYITKHSDRIICPSESFLKRIGKKSIWESYRFYSEDSGKLLSNCMENYDLESRLRYGFPISEEEHQIGKKEFTEVYKRVLKTK